MASDELRKWNKQEQVKAVPRHARKRMRELFDSMPGPPTARNGGMKRLHKVGEEYRRILRKCRGKK